MTTTEIHWKSFKGTTETAAAGRKAVAWIREQGGQAEFLPSVMEGTIHARPPRIEIRNEGSLVVVVAEDEFVVATDVWFHLHNGTRCECSPEFPRSECGALRTFRVMSREEHRRMEIILRARNWVRNCVDPVEVSVEDKAEVLETLTTMAKEQGRK